VNSEICLDRHAVVCRLAAHGDGDANDVLKPLYGSRAIF